jgi:hypothetical protein
MKLDYVMQKLAVVALCLLGLSSVEIRVAAQQDSPPEIALRPGLIFHPTLNVAYVMKPGGIAAVDLSRGGTQWTSNAAAKPLALVGNLLVSQVEPKTLANRLEIVVLDVQRGAPTVRGIVDLPTDVKVSIGESFEGKFLVYARPLGSEVVVTWAFEPRPRREIARELDIDQTVSAVLPKRGAFRLDLTTGRQTTLSPTAIQLPPSPRWILAATQKVRDAAPTQYESVDGRNILASELIGDDRVWEKYRWTVYERGSGQRVGEFRTHVSFATFLVRGDLLFYETTPFIRGGKSEPAKLRAVNLKTGNEIWSEEVRENVYRGPLPP